MKKNESTPPILIPPSSQPVQRPTPPRQSVPELSKPPAAPTAKKRSWKEKFHDAAMPIAGVTAVLGAANADPGAQMAVEVAAPAHPSSSTGLGTLGQHGTLSQAEVERLIRSTDLLDAVSEASPDLSMAAAIASAPLVLPAGNAPAPVHTGGTEGPETSKGWILLLSGFLMKEAGEIAKDLLNEPIERFIKDYLILRYAPKRVKALYSKEEGEGKEAARSYYTAYSMSAAETLTGARRLPIYPDLGIRYKLNRPTEGGAEPFSLVFSGSQTHGMTPEPTANSERIRALEGENESLRSQIAELKNANQGKATVSQDRDKHD